MRVEIVQQPPQDEQQNLPYMEAHHVDPDTGEDELALARRASLALAGNGNGAHSAARNPNDPDDLGQGRPQRGLPLRLGQEVQALPRPVRLTACLAGARYTYEISLNG